MCFMHNKCMVPKPNQCCNFQGLSKLWNSLFGTFPNIKAEFLEKHRYSLPNYWVQFENLPLYCEFGILLPKLFSPTVRKNCSSDPKKLLKLEAEGREFAKFLRSLKQFIQKVKGQNNFW